MHVLPSSKIPFAKIPLDMMISNKATFKKKYSKKVKDDSYRDVQATPIHEGEADADELGLIMLDEFPFEHVVFQIDKEEMTVEGLRYGYKKMSSFLQLDDYPDAGLTLIVAPKWMFLAPLYRPYHIEKGVDIAGGKDFDD